MQPHETPKYDGHTPIYEQRQAYSRDLEHLKLLSIFYYIAGGLGAFGSLIPCVYMTIGAALVGASAQPAPPPGTGGGGPPPAAVGWVIIGIAAALMMLILIFAMCLILAGRYLSSQRGYVFCLIMAGLECLSMPLGTILGVFTFIVLFRPSVRVLFGVDPPPSPKPAPAPQAAIPVQPVEPPPKQSFDS